MLEFEKKQRYEMQQSENNWHSGNGYRYGSEVLQMQPCPPPPPPPPPHQARRHKMSRPAGYPHRNNGWSHQGHHASGGEMWHPQGGRPNAAKFREYYGGGYSAGGMMVEEVEEEEDCYEYEVGTSHSGMNMQEMHYEQSNWADHGVGMGPRPPGPGHYRAVVTGYPRAEWVSKGL